MKRMLCLLCSLLLCLSCCPAAVAEDGGSETESLDLQRIEWAIAMTADIAGSALDRMDEAETPRQASVLSQFARLPYMSPEKAVVLEFSEDQVMPVKAALGIENRSRTSFNWEDVAPGLAEMINLQFSKDYAQAAGLTQAEGESSVEWSRYFTLILLAYGENISVTSLTGWGVVNSRSSMIISTKDISSGLGEKDVSLYIRKFGLDMPLVRVYEKDDLARLIARFGTSSSSQAKMAGALLSSEKRREALLPGLMNSDSPFADSGRKYHMAVSALRSLDTADQAFIRNVARDWLPMLAEKTEDPVNDYLGEGHTASEGRIAPPAITFLEELHEAEPKAGGTFLVVFDLTYPEENTVSWYDVILEAALPADRIPDSVEAADYIIRCSVTYEGGISNGGAHLHYPLTHITVHDAHTGEMIQDLGYNKRTLTGAVMLSNGDTWWHPLYTDLWLYISKLFN